MEETTLSAYTFLTGDYNVDELTREKLQYLFSPTIPRIIEQYDIEPVKVLIQRYAARIRKHGFRGRSLQQIFPKLTSEFASAIDKEAEVLATSIIDIGDEVDFDKDPFACNWSPAVLDSSHVNLFELDDNNYTFSASLPPACLELYSSVTAPRMLT